MSASLSSALDLYERQHKTLSYGTAGFRENVSLPLNSVFVKMGVLAALRSQSVASKCIGIMVTASHNPECDNGIKIVDADGGMMAQSWESYAEELVNARSSGDILLALERIAASHSIDRSSKCVVVVGRDTRPHSEELVKCIIQGAEAYGATVHDMGLVTTPQLHFIVQKANEQATSFPILTLDRQAAIANYDSTLGKGYLSLIESAVLSGQPVTPVSIVVDGSCGIGAISMADFLEHFQKVKPEALHIDIRNAAFSGPVNEGCGAEYVQKGQMPPRGVSADTDSGKTLCSFDGDADRIVFHSYLADTKQWILLDGDKIAALFSLFISQELVASGLHNDFSLGVVQTAYANGASTIFLRNNNIAVTMAKTGVKFLHHKAHEFDIGIYFEANGHGTVLFSNAFVKRLQSWESSHSQKASRTPEEERQELAMRRLIACTLAINQAVGDAVSDMLVSLACLQVLKMDIPSWHAIYTDHPSKQLKVPVKNKSTVQCSDDETYVLSPQTLQDELNKLMKNVPLGRCFVRPSGTEDVMRVYAEGQTQKDADSLAADALQAILTFVG